MLEVNIPSSLLPSAALLQPSEVDLSDSDSDPESSSINVLTILPNAFVSTSKQSQRDGVYQKLSMQ